MREQVARYRGTTLPGDELQDAIDEALAEVLADPKNADQLAQLGIDSSTGEGPTISVEERGVGPLVLAIIVGVGYDVTKEGAKALWRLVERKLKDRRGRDVLKDEEPDEADGHGPAGGQR